MLAVNLAVFGTVLFALRLLSWICHALWDTENARPPPPPASSSASPQVVVQSASSSRLPPVLTMSRSVSLQPNHLTLQLPEQTVEVSAFFVSLSLTRSSLIHAWQNPLHAERARGDSSASSSSASPLLLPPSATFSSLTPPPPHSVSAASTMPYSSTMMLLLPRREDPVAPVAPRDDVERSAVICSPMVVRNDSWSTFAAQFMTVNSADTTVSYPAK